MNDLNNEGINRTLDRLYQSMRALGYSVEDYDQACAKLVLYSKQSVCTYAEYSQALIQLLIGAMPLVTVLEQLDPNRPSDDNADSLRYAYASLYGGRPNYDRVNRWAVQGNGGGISRKKLLTQTRGYAKASWPVPGSTHQKRKLKTKKRGKG